MSCIEHLFAPMFTIHSVCSAPSSSVFRVGCAISSSFESHWRSIAIARIVTILWKLFTAKICSPTNAHSDELHTDSKVMVLACWKCSWQCQSSYETIGDSLNGCNFGFGELNDERPIPTCIIHQSSPSLSSATSMPAGRYRIFRLLLRGSSSKSLLTTKSNLPIMWSLQLSRRSYVLCYKYDSTQYSY